MLIVSTQQNNRLAGKDVSTTCHCEERSDVAIRFSLAQADLMEMFKYFDILGNGLPRRFAPRNDSGSRYLGGTIVR